MRKTYTSKPTSQRSTHIVCRIFGKFSSSINKILLDAQIREYNTKLSTIPNTYDESNNNTNALPTPPQLPNLHFNHPLSLFSRNFRNLAITNPPNLRPSHIQSPIQHIVIQHPPIDDTYKQIIEQTPYHHFSVSKYSFLLAHDEQTSWITPSIKLPPCQPPKSTPYYPIFCFFAT